MQMLCINSYARMTSLRSCLALWSVSCEIYPPCGLPKMGSWEEEGRGEREACVSLCGYEEGVRESQVHHESSGGEDVEGGSSYYWIVIGD